MKTYKAMEIANFFVDKANENDEEMTNLKLQKLVYFAKGFSLALFDKPLFRDLVRAWKWGPVVPDVYHAYKVFGSGPIPSVDFYSPVVDEETTQLLDRVYKNYGHLSGPTLSNLTHKKGTPWHQCYEEELSRRIPDDVIKSHFKELVGE